MRLYPGGSHATFHIHLTHGSWLYHLLGVWLLLGHDVPLTLSDILDFLLGDIGLLNMHHVEVHFGFASCCSDLIVL